MMIETKILLGLAAAGTVTTLAADKLFPSAAEAQQHGQDSYNVVSGDVLKKVVIGAGIGAVAVGAAMLLSGLTPLRIMPPDLVIPVAPLFVAAGGAALLGGFGAGKILSSVGA